MMETERLRLLDTFTDGEGEQTTVYGSRRAGTSHQLYERCHYEGFQ